MAMPSVGRKMTIRGRTPSATAELRRPRFSDSPQRSVQFAPRLARNVREERSFRQSRSLRSSSVKLSAGTTGHHSIRTLSAYLVGRFSTAVALSGLCLLGPSTLEPPLFNNRSGWRAEESLRGRFCPTRAQPLVSSGRHCPLLAEAVGAGGGRRPSTSGQLRAISGPSPVDIAEIPPHLHLNWATSREGGRRRLELGQVLTNFGHLWAGAD